MSTIVQLVQGIAEWHAYRLAMRNASESVRCWASARGSRRTSFVAEDRAQRVADQCSDGSRYAPRACSACCVRT